MTKTLTLWQPWASLVAMGLKRIETRSWSTAYRGPLLIHAAAKTPVLTHFVGGWAPEPHHAQYMRHRDRSRSVPMPLGAIVASCTLVDVVPMLSSANRGGCLPDGLVLDMPDDGSLPHQAGGMWLIGVNNLTHGRPTRVEDERPYGDFSPGRFAWLLEDVQSTDDRCPACWHPRYGQDNPCPECDGSGSVPVPGGGKACPTCFTGSHPDCRVCKDYGSVEPIPARGRQQLWNWVAA